MTDRWVRLNVRVSPIQGADDLISELLSGFDACGACQTSEDSTSAEWTIYFEPDKLPRDFAAKVHEVSGQFGSQVDIEQPLDQLRENWHEGWKKYFKAVRITPRIRIVPAWQKAQADGSETGDIYIMPGMAFGTGTHETTQLCMKLMENIIPPGSRVLDAGTGTAILSIAAVRTGARFVLGFDSDPDILENAAENLALNCATREQIQVFIGPIDCLRPGSFDVVLCNMLLREFMPLLPRLAKQCTCRGSIVLSGFLLTEESEVRMAIGQIGWQVQQFDSMGEWGGLIASHG